MKAKKKRAVLVRPNFLLAERDMKIVKKEAKARGVTEGALLRKWVRLGQLADKYIESGGKFPPADDLPPKKAPGDGLPTVPAGDQVPALPALALGAHPHGLRGARLRRGGRHGLVPVQPPGVANFSIKQPVWAGPRAWHGGGGSPAPTPQRGSHTAKIPHPRSLCR